MSAHLFKRALLVEDNESHALLIKRALKGFCSEILVAPNVQSAISEIDRAAFDLIITDLHLPDSVGLEHVEKFAQRDASVPIVVLTSSTSLEDAVEAMKRGARDFLVKSFEGQFGDSISLALSRVHRAVQLEREKLKLEREMLTLREAIQNSQDALAVIDRAGSIQWANRAFQSFVKRAGGQEESVYSIFTDKLNKPATIRASLERNLQSLSGGASWQTEITFTGSKDEAVSFSVSTIETPAGQKTAAVDRLVLWVRDISEQKRRERFQREILSTTTHDLKGPLGAIILSSELLADLLKGNDRSRDLALRIASSAQNSVNLIDEFLSARRIQEGTFILKPQSYDLVELISETVDNFQSIAVARGIAIEFQPSEPKVFGLLDKLGFSRVLGNLLSNAFKFTSKGGRVKVILQTDGDEVSLSVADTGSGMEPAEAQKLFERYSRLGRHGDIPGTGLGLFVVKSIVTAHGGKVEVQSRVGEGTTFTVRFPSRPPVNERGELISLDFA